MSEFLKTSFFFSCHCFWTVNNFTSGTLNQLGANLRASEKNRNVLYLVFEVWSLSATIDPTNCLHKLSWKHSGYREQSCSALCTACQIRKAVNTVHPNRVQSLWQLCWLVWLTVAGAFKVKTHVKQSMRVVDTGRHQSLFKNKYSMQTCSIILWGRQA